MLPAARAAPRPGAAKRKATEGPDGRPSAAGDGASAADAGGVAMDAMTSTATASAPSAASAPAPVPPAAAAAAAGAVPDWLSATGGGAIAAVVNPAAGSADHSAAAAASAMPTAAAQKKTAAAEAKAAKTKSRLDRGNYRCSKCGEPKKGHVCAYQPMRQRSTTGPKPTLLAKETQVEMDADMTVRALQQSAVGAAGV